jgi:hydroxymethylglutaryl-CoA reductase
MSDDLVKGFSKWNREEKAEWVARRSAANEKNLRVLFESFRHPDDLINKQLEEFSENTVTNYPLPFGVVPNVVINSKTFVVPMVTEESSVVAAAAKTVNFWAQRGGFKAQVLGTLKTGQIHLLWKGEPAVLCKFFDHNKKRLMSSITSLEVTMRKRGGGLKDIDLIDFSSRWTSLHPDECYFEIRAYFETCDAMGANYINTCLERMSQEIYRLSSEDAETNGRLEILMSILSNDVPHCLVKAWVECPVNELVSDHPEDKNFVSRFVKAVQIAQCNPSRAVTHNKGIMNAVDAVAIATGNDFRAIEAGVHAFASRDGSYQSLSRAEVADGIFRFEITLPVAVGTVGGLTTLHPVARAACQILGNPGSSTLMEIIAVMGLAQNFSAVRALVTSGIQSGHMRLHLGNLLAGGQATESEKIKAGKWFSDKTVSASAVADFLKKERGL